MPKVKRILFVCTANICRSPMAAALARRVLGDDIQVDSAGAMPEPDRPSPEPAARVMDEYGLDLTEHRSKPLSADLLGWADLVLAMEFNHKAAVATWYPEAREKTHLLTEYVGKRGDVPDPYGQGEEQYHRCARTLVALLEKLEQKLSTMGEER